MMRGRLLLASLLAMLVMAAATAAWADADDGAGGSEAAAEADGKPELTFSQLEAMMRDKPAAYGLSIIGKFGSMIVGVLLLAALVLAFAPALRSRPA